MVLGFCAGSVSYSIVSLAVYFKPESEPIPQWVRRFTLFLRNLCSCGRKRVGDVPGDIVHHHNELPPLSKKMQFCEEVSTSSESNDVNRITWKIVAMELDAFVLKVYFVVTTLLAVIFLSLVGSA